MIKLIALLLFSGSVIASPNNFTPQTLIGGTGVDSSMPSLVVSNQVGNADTYSIQINDFAPAALATDVLVIQGSATKKIVITKIEVSAHASGSGVIDFYVYKRSSLDTNGTLYSPQPTTVAHDSTNPSASATIKLYSANPTLGTGSLIRGAHYTLPGTSQNAYVPAPWLQEFGTNNVNQAIILNGVNESLAFSLNGQTIPSGFDVYLSIEWIEF